MEGKVAHMRTILISLLVLAPAFAEEASHSKRYHDAYVLEVIDGKPAAAARAYLELLEEKELSPRLRAQTEFRFAVTCVLLGRSDEARARLAALAEQEGLAKELRAQVDEYRKAIADVKLGTALETNLQALTMKLALKYSGQQRTFAGGVYREFDVLGPRSIPYLRRLLQHNDRELRWHAFQILARRDVPDLLDLWDAKQFPGGDSFFQYVRRHPEQMQKVEAILRRLRGGDLLTQVRGLQTLGTFSDGFIGWLATQPNCVKPAVLMLANRRDRIQTEAMILDWMRNGDEELRVTAAQYYGYWFATEGTRTPAEHFVPYCLLRKPDYSGGAIGTYAARVPPATRKKALVAVLDAAAADPKYAKLALVDGLADAIAKSVDPEVGTQVDARGYLVQLMRWQKLIHEHVEWEDWDEPFGVMQSLRRVILALPPEDGLRIVRQSQGLFGADRILVLLGFQRAADAALVEDALERVDSASKLPETLARSVENPHADRDYLRAVARIWPSLTPWAGSGFSYPFFFQTLATRVPAEEARQSLLATTIAVAKLQPNRSFMMLQRLFPSGSRRIQDPGQTYASSVLIPMLPKLFAALPARARLVLMQRATQYVDGARNIAALEKDRRRVAAAVLETLPTLGDSVGLQWQWMAADPALYPLESWARSTHATIWRMSNFQLDATDVERAARFFADDPTRINESVARMLARMLGGEARKPIAEEIGRKADARVLRWMVAAGLPPSNALLEKRVLAFNADDAIDDYILHELVKPLVIRAPSPRLFPVVRRLLRSENPGWAMSAMELAMSLGSEDLIPSIAPALDSMNARVREMAKKAIESILDSRRIKAEIAERLGEK